MVVFMISKFKLFQTTCITLIPIINTTVDSPLNLQVATGVFLLHQTKRKKRSHQTFNSFRDSTRQK
ncbi:hypothetical protein C9418_06975 [Rhizobium sp. SEMIA 4032]|nr:hypothetical protein C9418_06975 [Rhizobium sp. SEMIA 4032]